jgi:hypothetical protein
LFKCVDLIARFSKPKVIPEENGETKLAQMNESV